MTKAKKVAKKTNVKKGKPVAGRAKFPRHSIRRILRIPQAILEQHAGKPCTPAQAASFVGVGMSGSFSVEIASATKYGLLESPTKGQIQPTALAKKILRPQTPNDEVEGYQIAIMNAPEVSEVYQHYRGENLPDDQFLQNTLTETFQIPNENFVEFKQVLIENLESANLLAKHGEKIRVVDISTDEHSQTQSADRLKKLGKAANVSSGDTCFVMQPFAPPLGDYYEKIYKPAIEKTGLTPVRADAEIFGTGKIIDQVWEGINSAKVLVAELTSRNPNVFYELGLAHALNKPVVLVSAQEEDVPFDLQHIRVIYYNVSDPFWGNKLMDKVAENILSAINNPEEALFKPSK